MKRRWFFSIILAILLVTALTVIGKSYFQNREATANLRELPVVADLELPSRGQAPGFQKGEVFFVGNATVIIRFAGFIILTDPNFLHAGDHVHLGYGIKAKRLTNPAIEIEALPPIDLVVLSHMHGDHFDRLAQEKLDKSLPVVTTNEAASGLGALGFHCTYGLNPWETISIGKGGALLEITALPGEHGPGPVTHLLPNLNGHLLNFKQKDDISTFKLYISGDTLVHEHLKKIPQQFPDIDLALLHLGGTRVLGLTVSMDARQGVKALEMIAPREAIPIHYNDYDRFKSSLEDFKKAIQRAGLKTRVRYLNPGETYTFYPREHQASGAGSSSEAG